MLLIIDGNNQAFVANTAQSLRSKKGFPTQAIYGVLEALRHYLERFGPNHVIAVFDGGHSPLRKAIYPEYKQRDKTRDEEKIKEFIIQLPTIKEMLICLGVDLLERADTEADDAIAVLAQEAEGEEVIIISSDKDFYQLINPDISIYNPVSKTKIRYLNSSNFKRAKGLRPCQWLDYRAMTGDKGDNIPGCFGVGEKTALDILQKFGSYRAFRKAVIEGRYSVKGFEKKAFDGHELFDLSKRLMDLKNMEMLHDPENLMKSIKHGKQNKQWLKDMFKEMDMRDALHDLDMLLDMIPQ